MVGKAAKALDNDLDAGLALEALPELIDQLEAKMKEAAKKLDFEEAATCGIGQAPAAQNDWLAYLSISAALSFRSSRRDLQFSVSEI